MCGALHMFRLPSVSPPPPGAGGTHQHVRHDGPQHVLAAKEQPMPDDFHTNLVAVLPKLRIQALALTRNRAAADDLVQDTAMNALAAQDSFTPGTNFRAWIHRIL